MAGTSVVLLEGAKLALQLYFQYARLAGKSDEETHQMYLEQKLKFRTNNPANLEDTLPPDTEEETEPSDSPESYDSSSADSDGTGTSGEDQSPD